MKKITVIRFFAAAMALALLAGCSSKSTQASEPTAAPVSSAAPAPTATPVPTATPTATPTAAPTATPTAAPTATPTPTPTPTATPTATPTPSPTPKPEVPFVTKHPSNVTVPEGGSCQFEADYINAVWAVWHFVSPDGQTDITYEEINQRFPSMTVANGMYSTMQLGNIPLGMNGWKLYCRYTNGGGSTNTNSAVLTVTEASSPAAPSLPSAQEYLGSYQDKVSQRASMVIGGTPDILRVSIRWGSSAWETTNWFFTGRFDERGVLEYSGCIRTEIVFDNDGNETDTTVYENGSGKLEYLTDNEGGYLRWTDYTEGADRGAKFVKLPG